MERFLRSWRWLAIMLTALSLSPAMAHLLELPAKLRYDGALWLQLSQTLYSTFGTVGAFFEVGALIAVFVLILLVRRRWPAVAWTLAGGLLLLASHAAFWIWVAPVNAAMADLTPATLPGDWTSLRDQWEYTHAARAGLQAFGLGALIMSLLVETAPAASHARPARSG